MLNKNEEEILIARAKKGDQSAFKQIVDLHSAHLARTIKGMLGNVAESDDVGQEVFIRFYKSINQFEGKSSLKTYLTRIAINLSLNALKKRKRNYSVFESGEIAENSISKFGQNKDGLLEQDRKDIQKLVQKALSYLDPKFRTVLVLRMIQGYSTKETAQMMDVPLGTVLSRLNSGQKKLKEILTKLD